MNEETAQLLADIGFTRLEAVTYLHLIQEPSVTGYRVAQAIAKPVPNVYKALESLQKKGAIVCDESAAHRRYVALPIAGFLQQLHDQLQATGRKIEEQLADLPARSCWPGFRRQPRPSSSWCRRPVLPAPAT
jgi:sugar-specific transcriptional regulator TrmB